MTWDSKILTTDDGANHNVARLLIGMCGGMCSGTPSPACALVRTSYVTCGAGGGAEGRRHPAWLKLYRRKEHVTWTPQYIVHCKYDLTGDVKRLLCTCRSVPYL